MVEIDIPDFGELRLDHLVMDYNGTLACDGILIDGVGERLGQLREQLRIYVITADTFGKVRKEMEGLPAEVVVLPKEKQDEGKLAFIENLGKERTVCIGNGRNDRLMLREAALGISVMEGEGIASVTLTAGDIVCSGILDALDLLRNPLRLTATLRS
ncbi:MAG: ATPase P [Gemmatimonadetes bacterium]|mgnify:CR=1 FL=1|jgi:soluble P-type ATPase|nr:ATPase P [Gemmatimonadota bacterium]